MQQNSQVRNRKKTTIRHFRINLLKKTRNKRKNLKRRQKGKKTHYPHRNKDKDCIRFPDVNTAKVKSMTHYYSTEGKKRKRKNSCQPRDFYSEKIFLKIKGKMKTQTYRSSPHYMKHSRKSSVQKENLSV